MAIPIILNNAPLVTPVPLDDPYYAYYFTGISMGRFDHNNQLIFKFIGYNAGTQDPYNDDITYTYSGNYADAFESSPPESYPLQASATNGWLNGTIKDIGANIITYTINVTATTSAGSETKNFEFTIIGGTGGTVIDDTVTWDTDSDLGSIENGALSDLTVSATFGNGTGKYRLTAGSLPPGLEVLEDGNISGRVEFNLNPAITQYTFTIEAYNPVYPTLVTSTRVFTLTVEQKYTEPYDTIYMGGLLSIPDRTRITGLLNSITDTQSAKIYRPTDPYFGVAKNVRYQHQYGVPSVSDKYILTYKNTVVVPLGATTITLNTVIGIVVGQIIQSTTFLQPDTFITAVNINTNTITVNKPTILQSPIDTSFTTGNFNYFYDQYWAAVQRNFYWKFLTLGTLKTAIATDENGDTIYEVVYSEVVDNLVNNEGVSISKKVGFVTPTSRTLGPYWTSWTSIYTSNTYYDLSPLARAVEVSVTSATTITLNSVADLFVGMQVTSFPGVTIVNKSDGTPPVVTSIDAITNTVTLDVAQTLTNKQQIVFNDPVNTSYDDVEETLDLYPNSLPNMREQIAEIIGQFNNSTLLPRWMNTQQPNGSVLGYVPCWVLCYTKPGKSAEVLAAVNLYLAANNLTLNQITFQIDRITIDRSLTSTYGSVVVDEWPSTPSTSVDNNSQDSYIQFPRKTILY